MEMTSLQEAQTHLPQLIERAVAGEEIIIGDAGKPLAKIIGYGPSVLERVPGALRGKIKIAEDFDELPDDIAKAFGVDQT